MARRNGDRDAGGDTRQPATQKKIVSACVGNSHTIIPSDVWRPVTNCFSGVWCGGVWWWEKFAGPPEIIYSIQKCASNKIVLTLWLLIIAIHIRTENVLVKKRTQMEPKLTTVVGSGQAKKRFSVLIQILKVYDIHRNRIGSDLNSIFTVTGFFTVYP